MDYFRTYLYSAWDIMLELSVWLLVGMAIAGILHVLLPEGFVKRHLGGGLWGGVFKAVAVGVPLPLCSCGVIPAALGLRKDGASKAATVGFLISTPQTGVDSILVSASFLGWPFALFKVAAALVSGMVGGVFTGWFVKDAPPVQPLEKNDEKTAQETHQPKRGVKELIHFGFIVLLGDVYRWLIIGVLIAAAVATFIPEGKLAEYGWVQGPWGMVLVLLLSMPMYICAVASVPLAATLVAAGLPPGAALVLLMAGPTTNVATMGAILRGLGRGALAVYLLTVAVMSFGLGWLFNFLLTDRPTIGGHVHPLPEWINITAAVTLLGLLTYFLARDIRRWRRPLKPSWCHDTSIPTGQSDCCQH